MSEGARVPAVLVAFVAFSVLTTMGSLALFWLPVLHERLVPFIGWGPAMPYTFGLIFAIALWWRPNRVFHVAILGFLLLGAAFGAFEFLNRSRETWGNPWLTVSVWRPIWTVALPLVWCGLLLSPGVVRYCRTTSTGDARAAAGGNRQGSGA